MEAQIVMKRLLAFILALTLVSGNITTYTAQAGADENGAASVEGTERDVTATQPYSDNPVEEVEITDKEEIVTVQGILPAEASLKVEPVNVPGTDKTRCAYDITIMSRGQEIQPQNGAVEVSISDASLEGARAEELEVWHIGDDGAETKVDNFTVENGTVVFKAESFFVYVVVDPGEIQPTNTPTPTVTPTPTNTPTPTITATVTPTPPTSASTGDDTDFGGYLAMLGLAMAAMMTAVLYRRRREEEK